MNDKAAVEDPMEEQNEFELDPIDQLDSDDAPDLESAMREALDAVERVGERAVSEPEAQVAEETVSDGDETGRLSAEISELRARATRTLADFDNYRKRMDRELEEERRFANFELLRESLAIVDNLERALGSQGTAEDLQAGVELILKQLTAILNRHGVEKVDSVGETFDPNVHEAVSREEDSSVDDVTVSDELQAGYLMKGRLLRPAVVKVLMPPRPESRTEVEESDGEA